MKLNILEKFLHLYAHLIAHKDEIREFKAGPYYCIYYKVSSQSL